MKAKCSERAYGARAKPHGRKSSKRSKRSKNALLRDESLSRALCCLHEAEQTLTASTQLLDTLEKRVALTSIVADLETLQRRLRDLIKFREIDN
jgi:hypothetical protein